MPKNFSRLFPDLLIASDISLFNFVITSCAVICFLKLCIFLNIIFPQKSLTTIEADSDQKSIPIELKMSGFAR